MVHTQVEALMPPEASSQEREPTPLRPAIWVGSAADFAGDQRYGDWVDPAQLTSDLIDDIGRIVDRTPDGKRQQWAIHAMRGFGCWQPTEQDALPAYVIVARGIREHGPAFSALVNLVGADSLAANPERFRLSFVGEWPSPLDFARQFIEESGWVSYLDRLPPSMRPYVQVDVKKLLRDARRELDIVRHEQGIWVFDPRRW